MNSHEEQLILELASSSLPPEEAQRLEASLSEEAQRELAAHRLLLSAIASVEQPAMTDIERARLHRGVTEGLAEVTRELNATQIEAQRVISPRRNRSARWMRFASAAGAAAVLVGVVAVGTQLTDGASDSDTTSPAFAAAETTLAVAGSAESDVTDSAEGALVAPPAADQTTTSMASFRALSVPEAPDVDVITEEADLEELARFVTGLDFSDVDLATVEELACFDVANIGAGSLTFVKGFKLQYQDREAVGFQTDAVDDEEAIQIYDLQTCEQLATSPR